jgi:signal transduction histidine kinase
LTAGLEIAAGGGFNPFLEVVTTGPWLCGLVVAVRRDVAEQLEARAREIESEREVFAEQSVRYERTRIARELHDIVAHSVSLMVVQANAGEQLARRDPGAAAVAFESISEAAHQAEAEIDRLVELLDTSSPAAPPAGLRIVEDLVRRARASGLRVTCQFSGDGDDLSEPTAETVYRVVQEAVTNAMKHAPGAPIDIAVLGHSAGVEVRVVNRLPLSSPSGLEGAGGGHGLAGMRERVAQVGGSFSAGLAADGGWDVVARLPRHPHLEAAPVPRRDLPWG